MADSVKKGARVSGTDRSKLSTDITKKYASGSTSPGGSPSDDEVPDESGPVPESKAPQE
jgi:hypothetical protein